MKLDSAESPGMRAAHIHSYVTTVVDILMQDKNLLRPTAALLRKYHSLEIEDVKRKFEEDLQSLQQNRSRPRADNTMAPPDYVIKLTQTLHNLYNQRDKQKIKHQRGAIVEVLVRKMIKHRYGPSDFCLNSQHFVEDYRNITVKEVDVAALSNIRRKIEGYECKVSSPGFESSDRINLISIAEVADEKQYRVNVGFVSFDNDKVMEIKLITHQLPEFINLYGLDSIERLRNISFLVN